MDGQMERQQLNHLEQRYHHLDGRVGAMSEDLAAVKSTLVTVVQTLNKVADDLKPEKASVTSWLGVALVFVGMLGSAMWGVQAYVAAQVEPIGVATDRIVAKMDDRSKFILGQAYDHGKIDAQIAEMQRRIEDIDRHGSRRWTYEGSTRESIAGAYYGLRDYRDTERAEADRLHYDKQG